MLFVLCARNMFVKLLINAVHLNIYHKYLLLLAVFI